ncbi:MAG: endonuclease III domain-containing protein [Candidatus Omnitrophica bacterium]|nr:endonuclease III domain-containing protein [Candidatus Omnitrophota bacterium]
MKLTLNLIFRQLYRYFGPQRWWPAETDFEVIVGAILTQNTNWSNVEKAINNLKENNLLAPRKLYRVSEKKLASLIRPAGYYNIKAKRLKNFLEFLYGRYQGSVKKMSGRDTALLRQELLGVNGIGPETADSILLYSLEKPVFVVDAYTKRMLLRHKFILENADYHSVQKLFERSLKADAGLFNEYHALIVRLGKEFCLKNKPRCGLCPLG